MKKYIFCLTFLFLIMSCNNDKKEGIKKLNNVMNNINLASKTSDPELVASVIAEIEIVEKIYPKQQSLKESKYMLEVRLKRYADAIATIDTLLLISPNDVDNRIIQGILLEIIGSKARSRDVFETALQKMDVKIKNMLRGDVNKRLGREVNRVMLLKLLNIDQPSDYTILKDDPDMADYPEILNLLVLMENSPRDVFINNYR